jgi:hypothetical protein
MIRGHYHGKRTRDGYKLLDLTFLNTRNEYQENGRLSIWER